MRQIIATVLFAIATCCAMGAESRSLNVRDFGAVLDGETDDTSAIQKALDRVADNGVVFIPAGTAILSAPLTIENKSCTIRGDGLAATMLRWRGEGGIRMSESRDWQAANANPATWHVTGVRFEAAGKDAGSALSFDYDSSARLTPSVIVRDCAFQPSGTGYWTTSVYVRNGHLGQITGCYFRGGRGDPSTNTTTHHIHLTGNSTTFMIENCHGSISTYGILVEGVTEGVTISKCFFVRNAYGYVHNVNGEPMFDVFQSHAASSVHPLWIRNGRSSSITGNMFVLRNYEEYIHLRKPNETPAIVVIEGKTVKDVIMTGCTLNMNDPSYKGEFIGVDIRGGRQIVIANNSIEDRSSYRDGVRIADGVTSVVVSGNVRERR